MLFNMHCRADSVAEYTVDMVSHFDACHVFDYPKTKTRFDPYPVLYENF
jgi:hypothetical protein